MGSHDRIYDNSRNYIIVVVVVVVVAHKSPQLEFSNLENFSMEISDAFGAPSPTRYGRNFSFTKMNKFLALFSKRTCAHPAVSDVPHHFHKIFQRIGESTGKLSRVLLPPTTRIFLLFVLGRIKKSRLPSRAQMYDEKGEYNGENGSRTRRDFYARRYPNSRSYGIGSHKLKSTRALAREGTRRALSFRLLLFLCLRSWRSCDVRREAVQLQLHAYFHVFHLTVFSSHDDSSLSARSFFSNPPLSIFLVFVRLNDAIPCDQKRIRFVTRNLNFGERIVDCEMRSIS